jgi:glutathione synthase/RimK-type ligase-like ATP-grasp enzyme
MDKASIKQKGLLWQLAQAQSIKRLIPRPLKYLGRRLLPLESYDPQKWLAEDPYAEIEEVSTYAGRVDVCLGIIKEFTRIHSFYIGACRELGIPYKVIDISGPDWLDRIHNSGCDAYLVRPSGQVTAWKQMFDERLKILTCDLGQTIFPSYEAIWFYESKRRMHYWLAANGFAHPQTWVFYDREDALAFVETTPLPIVFKTDFGSGAMGVQILRDRRECKRLVNRVFRKGVIKAGGDVRDRQWGSVLFQAYLPDITEWRMIRIGDSFMGYQKLQKGDFHSGSHSFEYGPLPADLLDWVKGITDRGHFRSMALDVFVTPDRTFLVNELQTTFGLHVDDGLPMVDGKPGRYCYDPITTTWQFEEGNFCRNKLCNLRVEALLKQLGVTVPKTEEQVCLA